MKKKKLERRQENKMIAGVLSGLANYFDGDSSLFRIVAIIFLILTGVFPILLMYITAWLIMPMHDPNDDKFDYEIVG